MLPLILAAVWFGYRAKRAGKNIIIWSIVGILVFFALKILVTVIAVNASANTMQQARDMTIFLNMLLFGGIFLIGFFIKPNPLLVNQESGDKSVNNNDGISNKFVMSGKCKICGYQAGIFNLKDGICKSCISTDKTNPITDFNETNKPVILDTQNNLKGECSVKNPIIYSTEYGEYYISHTTCGIKNKKYFNSPEEAVEYIKSNPKKYIEIEDPNALLPYSQWISQALEAKEEKKELTDFKETEINDKYNQTEQDQYIEVGASSQIGIRTNSGDNKMKCQSCGDTTRINWGGAYSVLCEACRYSDSGKELIDANRQKEVSDRQFNKLDSFNMSISKRFLIGAIIWFVGLSSYAFYEYTECQNYTFNINNSEPGAWLLAPQDNVTENFFFIVSRENFWSQTQNKKTYYSIPISIHTHNLAGYIGIPVIVFLLLALATRTQPANNSKDNQDKTTTNIPENYLADTQKCIKLLLTNGYEVEERADKWVETESTWEIIEPSGNKVIIESLMALQDYVSENKLE